jgi:glycosyltransferase involved in cell wall biosynthesis
MVTGTHAVDIVPNGVDGDWFQPGTESTIPNSCNFWGRLDAGPNIEAILWFSRSVWPAVRRVAPEARFSIFGFNPVSAVQELNRKDGIAVVADVADLRPLLRQHEVAVMPFVSGGGIKNKLLEAAALGLPVICTPRACGGLRFNETRPLTIAKSPSEWLSALTGLWSDQALRRRTGTGARRWVLEYHSWEAAARAALCGLAARTNPPVRTTPCSARQ